MSLTRPLDPAKVLGAIRILGLVFLVCLPDALFLCRNNYRDIENYVLIKDCRIFYKDCIRYSKEIYLPMTFETKVLLNFRNFV